MIPGMRGKAVQLGWKETFSRQIGHAPAAFGFFESAKEIKPSRVFLL